MLNYRRDKPPRQWEQAGGSPFCGQTRARHVRALRNAGAPRVQPGAIDGSGGMHINKRRYIDAREGPAWAPHHAAGPKSS